MTNNTVPARRATPHHLLGLTGHAGVGKDTVADLLVAHARFRKLAFADALRGEIANAFSISLDDLLKPHLKNVATVGLRMRLAPRDFLAAVVLSLSAAAPDHRTPLSDAWLDEPRSPRQIMQWWGTEYRRAQAPRYWTQQLINRLAYYRREGETRFVVTDVRFDNEADSLRMAGGAIWQVIRPGHVGQVENAHISATDGARFEPVAVINNAHDVRHLQGLVLTEFVARDFDLDRSRVQVTVTA
ncbi:hypothetical protein J2W28_000199 [Variovorax boronicumulans]|uniref:deoxynucleotide monophosphate kinase family protein n=1 Tax=Variovorax boronicumulans TaxID=436515 RepID=UPI002783DC3E|nr:hypothetical protein [Variovorax boronicumulans]MDP9990418.1 hypothetical protein [Variovorax boronicumulans]MDQ0001071.1 hypothetical protein [Variovorax boronicumulans]